jgi:hypothetical protein
MKTRQTCKRALLTVLVTLALASIVQAQCKDSSDGIVSRPNRPTVSTSADTTQCGVLEMEYGWLRSWPGAGSHSGAAGNVFRFGVLENVDVRFGWDNFVYSRDAASKQSGIGDNSFAVKYRFHNQSKNFPALGLTYAVKFPSASVEKGLGSGRVDHYVGFLASKDSRILRLHVDFNAGYVLAGHEASAGANRNCELALAFSRPVAFRNRLGLSGEFSGGTRRGDSPGHVGTLWAVNFAVKPRWVLDMGVSVGLNPGATRRQFFFGMTYAIGNVYKSVRAQHRPLQAGQK